jgi:hypothetical protein
LHQESLDKILDLFQNWEESEVIKVNPSGAISRRFLRRELKASFFRPLGRAYPNSISRNFRKF